MSTRKSAFNNRSGLVLGVVLMWGMFWAPHALGQDPEPSTTQFEEQTIDQGRGIAMAPCSDDTHVIQSAVSSTTPLLDGGCSKTVTHSVYCNGDDCIDIQISCVDWDGGEPTPTMCAWSRICVHADGTTTSQSGICGSTAYQDTTSSPATRAAFSPTVTQILTETQTQAKSHFGPVAASSILESTEGIRTFVESGVQRMETLNPFSSEVLNTQEQEDLAADLLDLFVQADEIEVSDLGDDVIQLDLYAENESLLKMEIDLANILEESEYNVLKDWNAVSPSTRRDAQVLLPLPTTIPSGIIVLIGRENENGLHPWLIQAYVGWQGCMAYIQVIDHRHGEGPEVHIYIYCP